ncbi:MAG: HAMP domain-containing sensor histidine kinase [Hyphomicrobium sp.]
MSQKHSSTPPIALPAAAPDSVSSAEWKVLEAGSLLAQFGSYGLIWLNRDLTVEDTFGPLIHFVAIGRPITDSILAIIGLEQEILALAADTRRVLELPAVAVVSNDTHSDKLNFTFFWNAGRDCPMALAYRSASQTELEIELSKQIRARLMAEAEVMEKSRELARANADLESFATIISHDLKAPLRHMRHLTESAFDTSENSRSGSMRDILRAIDGQSQRMSHMLTALFDYSSLGRKYEAMELVDTGALIVAIAQSLPETGHHFAISGHWPVVSTLRAPLDLVLRNLVANAVQHHDRPTGQITASCEEQRQQLVIKIADDGPGIDPHHHQSIFLPFRTLKAGNDSASTGMGLAAVKKSIDGMGGSIEVASNPQTARGTTFTICWPKVLRY